MATSQMDWDKEVKLEKLEDMITVYEEHIKTLEEENKSLKAQVVFLKEQLKYKTFGKPCYNEEAIEQELDMIAKYQDQIDIIHKYFKK